MDFIFRLLAPWLRRMRANMVRQWVIDELPKEHWMTDEEIKRLEKRG